MRPLLLLTAAGLACAPPAASPTPLYTVVADSLHLGREEPTGVAPGFDVDGFKSDWRDGRGCHKPDFQDPEGNAGIDNQLATLMPLIDLAGENALEGLLQGAINEGRLLLVMRAVQLGDGQVQIEVLRGEDRPLLGTDGRLLADQTLGLAGEPLLGRGEGAVGADGRLEVGPFSLRLPVVVFTELYVLDLVDARLRLVPGEGGYSTGVIGGGVTLQQIFAIVRVAGERAAVDLESLIGGGIRDSADLARDEAGACQRLSLGASFRSVRAHTYDEPSR